jgi:hypothetical protein
MLRLPQPPAAPAVPVPAADAPAPTPTAPSSSKHGDADTPADLDADLEALLQPHGALLGRRADRQWRPALQSIAEGEGERGWAPPA